MIVTLTGANSFGLDKALQALAQDFTSQHSELAIEKLDGEEASLDLMQAALTSLPLFDNQKLVILHQPSKHQKFVEKFEQVFDNLPETTEVIIVEPKLDKRLGYYKYLKSKTDFREFVELDQNGLVEWLVESAKQQAGSISQAEARYLIERVGLNQQLLDSELTKLLLYQPAITRQSIDLLTEPTPQSTVFQLLEAAFGGNQRRALALYEEQRALKVEPQQIIAMLAWQLQALVIIKTAGQRTSDVIAKEARLNPFVVRKTQAIARRLSLQDVKQMVSDLLNIDIRGKTTNLDIDEALQNYLLALAR